MGHQFARSTLAAALAISGLVGCGGGGGEAEPPPVLDNARAQLESGGATSTSVVADTTGDGSPGGAAPLVTELPLPDASEYEGSNRVVNLWVGPGGQTQPVDVWGRRTFTNGPILLVDDLEFGEASEYFAAPPGYSLVVVGAGAGPDGEELAGVFNAGPSDQLTMIFTNDDPEGGVWAPNLWEATSEATGLAPAPPQRGSGVVYLFSANTRAFDETLTASIGGSSFYVGDGTATCAHQRVEDQGFQANVLGGTQDVQLELPPGPTTISLHPWFSPDDCDQPAALDVEVDVPVDGIVMVLVFSRDGETIETLELPVRS